MTRSEQLFERAVKRIIKTKSSYIDSKYILMDIYEGFFIVGN